MKRISVLCFICFVMYNSLLAQLTGENKNFTHQDTLRGSITTERAWWDVLRYDISVEPDYTAKSISCFQWFCNPGAKKS